MKRCPRCSRDLPLSEFWADRSRSDGRCTICRACAALDERSRYHASPTVERGGKLPADQVRAAIDEYVAGGVTVPELADRLGVTHSALAKRFRRLGVQMHGRDGQPERYPCPFSNDRLHELYWKLSMTMKEIAQEAERITGRSASNWKSMVTRWLRAADIPIRSAHEAMQRRAFAGKLPPRRAPRYETRTCALCGRPVTRRACEFTRPPERTFCGTECSGRWLGLRRHGLL